MKTFKIIEIMGDFSTLIDEEILADNIDDAKRYAIEMIRNDIDKYLYAVMEEGTE